MLTLDVPGGEGLVLFFNSSFIFLSSGEEAVGGVFMLKGNKINGVSASDGCCSGLFIHILVAWLEKFIHPIGRLGGWVGDSEGMEALL